MNLIESFTQILYSTCITYSKKCVNHMLEGGCRYFVIRNGIFDILLKNQTLAQGLLWCKSVLTTCWRVSADCLWIGTVYSIFYSNKDCPLLCVKCFGIFVFKAKERSNIVSTWNLLIILSLALSISSNSLQHKWHPYLSEIDVFANVATSHLMSLGHHTLDPIDKAVSMII